ncbi:MAG: hypothetical protein ACW99G_05380 [Candidatus Thorarchaeota archaeon]|jgi:hypothetical protein
MKRNFQLIPLIFIIFMMVSPLFLSTDMMAIDSFSEEMIDSTQLIDIGGGDVIEVAPDEALYKISSEQGYSEWSGLSSPNVAAEYGSSTSFYENLQMKYLSGGGTTQAVAEVSKGIDWEAYDVQVDIASLTENRTWVQNPGFQDSAANWSITPTNSSHDSTVSGTWVADVGPAGVGDDCIEVEIDSDHPNPPHWYDGNDQAWVRQTFDIDRGTVVWAGFRLDYWADTQDDTHYNMTGSFSLYLNLEGTYVWKMVFEAIDEEETWYDSGLVDIDESIFQSPTIQNISAEFGLWSIAEVGYAPEINPRARFDNIEIYVKTRVNPSEINFQMNGVDFADGPARGECSITETPLIPWTTSPVPLNFSWTPVPSSPSPDEEIRIDFDANIRLFTRQYNVPTHYEINPTAYGERYIIWNGTQASFTSYFRADIPAGYSDFYFFNETIPSERDVYFVAMPLAPISNLTSGWSGGNPGDGYVNVSTYDITSEPGRYGYWRILSNSPNMINDLRLWNPNTTNWERNVNLRAGDTTQIRVYLGAGLTNSLVNITVYEPDGSEWLTVTAVADASGYATTSPFALPGLTAPAGSWMVQAITNDTGATGSLTSVGFFKRPFNIIHSSEINLLYPSDAVETMITNVTWGDLLLIILEANDTESSVLIPGGNMTLDWGYGTEIFDDNGNGQYTKVLDTSILPGKGQHILNLEFTHPSFDSALDTLTLNVRYAATLTSPDYPGIVGPVNDNQLFSVLFANINGTGITTATVWCNWSNPYSMTPLGSGQYQFDLDTSGMPIGEYPITVFATGPNIVPQSLIMYVGIREVYNSITYTSNQLSIPVGDAGSFLFTWTDTDHGAPVTGSASSITCNWTGFHQTGDQNYTVVETPTPGVYNITIYTKNEDPLTVGGDLYTVVFNVMKDDHQNHTFDIGVEIRKRNTLFVLDEPVSQTPFGDTISVLVFYQDTDLRIGIENGTGEVRVTVTSSEVPSLSFTSNELGLGHYNITFLSDQWGSIGTKDLTIFIEWIGSVDKYYNQTILSTVRIIGTDTDLYLELAPSATYYQDSFNFTVVYWDAIGLNRIDNSTFDILLLVTPLDAGHSVTQADFTIYESSSVPGTYVFLLDSSLFPDTTTYQFQLDFMWSKGASPLYENQTLVVSLLVLDGLTYVDYAPIPSTPYGEWAVLTFSYFNALTNTKIDDSIQLQVSINEPGVSYNVSYNALAQEFTVMIDTSTLPGIGTHIIHLNVTWTGVPFYAAVENHPITITVILRNTQLTHLSFAPSQWGNNVSIEFIYTDLVAGITIGMTGTISLDVDSSKYSVTYIGNGHYLIILNTTAFGSDGVYQLNASIIHTNPNYASAIDIFDISILKRSTQIGYDSPDATAYQANVTFIVTYVDDSTGGGISGASVVVTGNGTSSLILNTNYWITYLGSGEYSIDVDSVALGSPNPYLLSVSVTFTGPPFYLPQSMDIIAWVTTRPTQILITQTPGEVPFLEDVVFRFKYEDYLLGTKVVINKSDITLSHGPSQTVILSGDYVLTEFATYYEISFNSSILNPSSLVTGYEIQFAIDTGVGVPYYDTRSITTRVTTIERPTQILFPLVVDTPYYDNITIELSYIDFLTGSGIDGASLLITSLNWTIPEYQLIQVGSGIYRILINSSIFGETGTVYFDLTLSKSGSPFYDTRTTLDVPAMIREVQTSLLAEAPPPGSTAVGVPIEVILTLRDFDHNRVLENAVISTNWTLLFGTSYQIEELGGGDYKITLNTTGLLAERHEFQVWADLQFHETAVATVSIQPGASTVEILLSKTVYYADWGEILNITFEVRETFYGTPIPGMDGTLLWNGTIYPFTDLGNGFYILLLDTSFEDVSIFNPQITVTKQYYQQRQKSFTLVVSKATGTINPEFSVYNVVIDTISGFTVYLNDTVSDNPVVGVTVTAEWNGTVYPMTPTGVPGFYIGSVDATGFAIGPYLLTIRAVSANHVFLETVIDINIVPIPTSLGLADGATLLNVFFGDTVDILAIYNDTFHALLIGDANVTYTLGDLTGQLTPEINGTYSANIDVSSLASQSIYLRIIAVKDGYATGIKSIIITILPIPTQTSVDTTLNSAYFDDMVNFTFYYHDDQHDVPIIGANVFASWDGGTVAVVDLGTGYYFIEVNITLTNPGLYDLVVRFDLTNYTSRTVTVNIEIYATPASIIGPNEYNVPINDAANILFEVQNSLDESTITDVVGFAFSTQFGQIELVQQPSGLYALPILGNIPQGTYTFDISFITAKYTIAPHQLVVNINQIRTEIRFAGNLTISTSPGTSFAIELTYYDLDHGIAIPGADITVTYNQDNITWYENDTTYDNGVYTLYFQANAGRTFSVTITLAKEDHVTAFVTYTIRSDISAAQQFQQAITVGGGSALILVALLIVAYVRIWSVPKQIREMNRMIRALSKGRIPKAPSAPSRKDLSMEIINEEIESVKLKKDEDEIVEYPLVTTVPEVNELLEELASITGLGEVEIEAFKADLARMRASERPGFLKEVIDQEKARRADVLAKPPVGEPAAEEVLLSQRPEELEDLRQSLLKKGMAADEIDVIIEEAKSLSKADLDALLSSLGIDMD